VFELEDRYPGDPLDQPDTGLVELLDAGHLIDRVLRAPAERLDHPEPCALGGAATGRRPRQLPPDVVDRMPGEIAVDDLVPVAHRSAQVGEPVQEHHRRQPGERTVVDRDAAATVRQFEIPHRRRFHGPERIEHGTGHGNLQDTNTFLTDSR